MIPKPQQHIPADQFYRELERMDQAKRAPVEPVPSNVVSLDAARQRLRPAAPHDRRA
jgi:hypothetical protein